MKRFYLFLSLMCFNLCTFAQETSLVVDCQNPGWLSNMIIYGNQRTIQDLKVSGYINATDLKFIGEMMSKQSLRGCIDLEDANIVGATTNEDNVMPENSFNINWSSDYPDGLHISHIKFPLSMSQGKACLSSNIKVDTITIGGECLPSINGNILYKNTYTMDGISFNRRVKHLILREGVTNIPDEAFYNNHSLPKEECIFVSIQFPSTLNKIGKNAFRYNYALADFTLPNNLESIEQFAFSETSFSPDTLILPNNLKSYHTSAIENSSVLYFGTNITEIKNTYTTFLNYQNTYYTHDVFTSSKKKTIHIKAITPPKFTYYSENCLKGYTIYVPKNSIELYKAATVWKNATILSEPNPATSIKIDVDSIELVKGNTKRINVIISPSDADSKTVIWSSSNSNVASISSNGIVTAVASGDAVITVSLETDNTLYACCNVKVTQPVTELHLNAHEKEVKVGDTFTLMATITPSYADNKNIIWKSDDAEIVSVDNGKVTALKAGETYVTAISEDNKNIVDRCLIKVTQPVTSVALNYSKYTFKGIGSTLQLEATIEPEDASNKDIDWRSSNEDVCIVSNGKVVAVGFGTCVIIAITADGSYMATCTISVVQPVTGISLNFETYTFTEIGKSIQLVATIVPNNASNKEIIWKSSNNAVCFVSNGVVVSLGLGTATITAESVDGHFRASCDFESKIGDKKGDVDCNGEVNYNDVKKLVSIVIGKEMSNINSDVNKDGIVNIADIAALINLLLGK